MLQMTIDNSIVESFLYKKFNGNITLVTQYINTFLLRHLPLDRDFEDDRKNFVKTYQEIIQDKATLIGEDDADKQIDDFLKTL